MHQAPLFFVFKHVLLANTHQPSFPFRVNSLGVKLASLALDAIMNARVSVEAQLQVTPPPSDSVRTQAVRPGSPSARTVDADTPIIGMYMQNWNTCSFVLCFFFSVCKIYDPALWW